MRPTVRSLVPYILALVLFVPTGSSIALETESPTQTVDASRILSIGGDITEILYAMNFGKQIVAVDTTSLFPPQALKTKTKVGYMRALSAEGVLSVAPSVILASQGAGPPEAVRALKSSSIPYVVIPDTATPEGIAVKIRSIAEAIGATDRGEALASAVASEFDALKRARETITRPQKVLFVLNASGGRMIVGGSDTSADSVLKLAGAENAAATVTGFKPITPEALIAMSPDAILVMKGGRGGHDASGLRNIPAVKASPAAKNGKIKDVDGLPLLGFGPRTPGAARELMSWLYPESSPTE